MIVLIQLRLVLKFNHISDILDDINNWSQSSVEAQLIKDDSSFQVLRRHFVRNILSLPFKTCGSDTLLTRRSFGCTYHASMHPKAIRKDNIYSLYNETISDVHYRISNVPP